MKTSDLFHVIYQRAQSLESWFKKQTNQENEDN